jgi:hypothetical protein
MRNVTLTFFLAIVLHLVVGVDGAHALPQCSNSSYRHNCEDTVTYPSGNKYVGAYKDGKRHGQGIYTWGNGNKYVGAFKNGKRHGQGTAIYADGGKYVGAFKNGKRHGQGTFTYPSGSKHVGTFKNNKRNGQGTYTSTNGRIKEGIWEANKFLYAQKAPARGKSIAEKENERLRKENARLKRQQQSQPKKIAKKPAKKSPPPKTGGTGSGFFVSKLGHIVTNEHVVRSCGSITVGDSATKQVGATLLEKDKRNDLALLRISSTQMASAESKSLISKLGVRVEISAPNVPLASGGLLRPDDVELGEDLLVSGYPLWRYVQ